MSKLALLIEKYLNSNYYLKNNMFFSKEERMEWGKAIVYDLSKLFEHNFDSCENVFRNWAIQIGFPEDEKEWIKSYTKQRLETRFNHELFERFRDHISIEQERNIIESMRIYLRFEVRLDLLDSLLISEATHIDFIDVMRCEGYYLGPALIEGKHELVPSKSFLRMQYQELLDERQGNIRWQNWIRSTKRNSEA